MSQITDQIKERIGVVEFLSEYLKLDRAGSNYKALCPFHNEKTPSFMVNPERNFWYCFGCQKGGDIFSFMMEMEGIQFREALEKLAERAGVEIPRFTPVNKEEKSQKQKILEILEAATKFYEFQLRHNLRAKQALEYLYQRKIQDEQLALFRVGYAPDGWRNILDYLLKRGFKLEDILASGLLVQKEESSLMNAGSSAAGNLYDRFRDRIMFPIIDVGGAVVGYSARVMPGGDEKTAKYINTPQTLVYDKSRILYGLHQARTEIKKQNLALVVEGNLDVIASQVAGVGNVVAVSGTALTEPHLQLLRRYTNNLKLCFDMDQAGQQATTKSIQACLLHSMEVEIVTLPAGLKDVNDTLIKDPSLWLGAIEKSLPVMKYYFDSALKNFDSGNIKEKKLVAQKLLNVIKDIADPIEQSYWLKKLASQIEVEEEVLTKVLEKVTVKKDTTSTNHQRSENNVNNKPRKFVLEQRLLGLFSLFPNELKNQLEDFDEGIFSPQNYSLWQKLKLGNLFEDEQTVNSYAMNVKYYHDQKEGFVENKIDPVREWKTTWQEILKERKKETLHKMVLDIRKAEQSGDEGALKLLLEEFAKLTKEKNTYL